MWVVFTEMGDCGIKLGCVINSKIYLSNPNLLASIFFEISAFIRTDRHVCPFAVGKLKPLCVSLACDREKGSVGRKGFILKMFSYFG